MEVGHCAIVHKQSNLEHMDTAHCDVNDKEWEAFKKTRFHGNCSNESPTEGTFSFDIQRPTYKPTYIGPHSHTLDHFRHQSPFYQPRWTRHSNVELCINCVCFQCWQEVKFSG